MPLESESVYQFSYYSYQMILTEGVVAEECYLSVDRFNVGWVNLMFKVGTAYIGYQACVGGESTVQIQRYTFSIDV
ncbi:hypothetical protein FPSE_05081 [Fusarium pseudograminearum CS3096]|uniref:Uncharacterized protein n=1 Tax=Fusarium pseudograminearum (strain CS3096) TaxID=1028729 RepID=K3UQU9_FUSPC|nr:hypothetical protein FPSE_05081 [Fusarium pseudograminearum CS3096]EKJ74746.1 hypothetical protein FPSE_05081 [Fusarium pseudograminearum CS3096]